MQANSQATEKSLILPPQYGIVYCKMVMKLENALF